MHLFIGHCYFIMNQKSILDQMRNIRHQRILRGEFFILIVLKIQKITLIRVTYHKGIEWYSKQRLHLVKFEMFCTAKLSIFS